MDFAVERVEQVWDELLPNLYRYYLETGLTKQGVFAPSMDRFKQYQDAGAFVLITARLMGKLVGHCGMYLTKSMYTDALVATEDGWFVRKEYRKYNEPMKAYLFIEKEMVSCGAKEMIMETNLKISRFMSKLGYNQSLGRHSKYLDGADSPVDKTIGELS